MISNTSSVKVTLEINQETNLEELMAHLCLMKNNIPSNFVASDDLLPDFSIHEGELSLIEPDFFGS
jgi:hypothetical protein